MIAHGLGTRRGTWASAAAVSGDGGLDGRPLVRQQRCAGPRRARGACGQWRVLRTHLHMANSFVAMYGKNYRKFFIYFFSLPRAGQGIDGT